MKRPTLSVVIACLAVTSLVVTAPSACAQEGALPYRVVVLFKKRERFWVRVSVPSEELMASLVKGRMDSSSVKL